jgi:hypothetical protein
MRLVIVFFVLAVLTMAATTVGSALWNSGISRRDPTRAIHYDTQYDLSAQRRVKAN